MKSIKTILLTVLLLIGFIVPSCNQDDDGCIDCQKIAYFDVEGLKVDILTSDGVSNGWVNANDTLLFAELSEVYVDYEAESLPIFIKL